MRARVKSVKKKRRGSRKQMWSSRINYQNVVFLLLLHNICDFYSFQLVFAYKKSSETSSKYYFFIMIVWGRKQGSTIQSESKESYLRGAKIRPWSVTCLSLIEKFAAKKISHPPTLLGDVIEGFPLEWRHRWLKKLWQIAESLIFIRFNSVFYLIRSPQQNFKVERVLAEKNEEKKFQSN